MFSKSNIFCLNGTLDSQMSELSALRISDPSKSDYSFKLGENLIKLSASGQLRKIIQIVNNSNTGDILFYFVVKMFHEALINGHLMVAAFIIDQGYPFNSPVVPNALLEALNIVDDFLAASLIEFLVISKGMDINCQAKKTWLTPLHISVRRGLGSSVQFLLKNGADVNAVAEGDCMPLMLAEGLEISNVMRNEIITALNQSGAKKTWRKDQPPGTVFKSFSGGNVGTVTFSGGNVSFMGHHENQSNSSDLNFTQNSMVSFKSGGDDVRNIGTSVTTNNGVDEMSNNTSKITKSNTSSSIPHDDLAQALYGTSNCPLLPSQMADSRESSGKTDTRKKVYFSSSLQTPKPHSVNSIDNTDDLVDKSQLDVTESFLAEPKALPQVRDSCVFSSNEYHSRKRDADKLIGIEPSLSSSIKHLSLSDNLECNNGFNGGGIEEDKLNIGEIEKVNDDTASGDSHENAYYLSDDGAFVFSTSS